MKRLFILALAVMLLTAGIAYAEKGKQDNRIQTEDDNMPPEKIREQVKLQKDDFERTKLQLRDCLQNSTNKTECNAVKLELKTKAKESLQTGIERAIQAIEATKSRIMADSQLDQAKRDAFVAKFDEKISQLNLVMAKAKSLGNHSNDTEINDAVKEAKEKWEDAKNEARQAKGKFNNEKAGLIITKMEKLSDRLAKIIQRYTDKGIDTSSANELKTQFDAKVADAKTKYESAKALWDQPDMTAEQVKEAQQYMKESQASLKDAHTVLKEISAKLKDLANATKPAKNETRQNETD